MQHWIIVPESVYYESGHGIVIVIVIVVDIVVIIELSNLEVVIMSVSMELSNHRILKSATNKHCRMICCKTFICIASNGIDFWSPQTDENDFIACMFIILFFFGIFPILACFFYFGFWYTPLYLPVYYFGVFPSPTTKALLVAWRMGGWLTTRGLCLKRYCNVLFFCQKEFLKSADTEILCRFQYFISKKRSGSAEF